MKSVEDRYVEAVLQDVFASGRAMVRSKRTCAPTSPTRRPVSGCGPRPSSPISAFASP